MIAFRSLSLIVSILLVSTYPKHTYLIIASSTLRSTVNGFGSAVSNLTVQIHLSFNTASERFGFRPRHDIISPFLELIERRVRSFDISSGDFFGSRVPGGRGFVIIEATLAGIRRILLHEIDRRSVFILPALRH